MKPLLIISITLTTIWLLCWQGGCSYRHVDEVKAHAEEVWNKAGYDVIGYEGYVIGDFMGSPGGKVWYIVRRHGQDKVTYHGYISKWFNEYHIYDLRAIDAIQP